MTSPRAANPDYFPRLDLLTRIYLLMGTVYGINENQCHSTRPLRTDVTLSPSIVLCPLSPPGVLVSPVQLSPLYCHKRRAILHTSDRKLHDTNSILCTCQSQFKPHLSGTDICSVSRTNT